MAAYLRITERLHKTGKVKATEKEIQEFLRGAVPLCDPSAELENPRREYRPEPEFINHKRRLRTLVRQAKDRQELAMLTRQYIDKYPNPENFNLKMANA